MQNKIIGFPGSWSPPFMGSFTIAVGELSEVVIAVQHLKLPPPQEESIHFLFFFFENPIVHI